MKPEPAANSEVEDKTVDETPHDGENSADDIHENEVSTEVGDRRHPRAWFYGLTAGLGVLVGGASDTPSLGLLMVMMGLCLIMAPPRFRLRALPAGALLALAIVPALGFLPAGWFGALPEWRALLIQEWSVKLPSTYTPEILTTLEGWLIMLCGIGWLWSALGQNLSDAGRRLLLRILAFSSLLIATLSLLDFWRVITLSWWARNDGNAPSLGLGPFANHNHASSFFAMSSVLCAAAAFDAFKRGSRLWLVFTAGVFLQLAAILSNTSRAGLGLFFLGMTLWLATVAMKRGFFRKATVSVALILAITSVVIVAGGQLGNRLTSRPLSEAVGSDLRWWLAEETLLGTVKAPWMGHGLGSFERVFPLVSKAPYPDARPLHPESDILWLLFEGGLLALVPCLIFIYWFLRSTGPWFSHRKKKSHESRSVRRIRKACAIAAMLALIHATVEVPLHGFAYFAVFALVLAQSIRPRYLAGLINPLQTWLFRAAGVLILLFGCYWLALSRGADVFGMDTAAYELHDRALDESNKGRKAEAMTLINRAIQITPLEFRWYYLRAQLHLAMGHDLQLALQDFGRARNIEPRFATICMNEGQFWLHYDPNLALIAWREGMRRYPAEFANALPRYQDIVIAAQAYPEIMPAVWKLADRTSLQLIFLSSNVVRGELWNQCLTEFLASHPVLSGVSPAQARYFLNLWQIKGDQAALVKFLKDNQAIQSYAWQVLAKDLAQSGNFEEAYRLAARHLPSPARSASLSGADIPRLERAHILNPVDPLPGVELYYAQRTSGDMKSARRTLEKVMALPNAPDFLKRELASLSAETGDMRAAWDAIFKVMEATPPDMSIVDEKPLEVKDLDKNNFPQAPPPRTEMAQ